MEIEKASEIGFCFGVRRAINMLEEAAREHGEIESLGAAVHNRTVVENLARRGIRVISSLEEVTGPVVALSSHGVGPSVFEAVKERKLHLIDTTCPRVRHAQRVAADLAAHGFFVVIFGDANHPEVKGIMGWAGGNGIACMDEGAAFDMMSVPLNIGILSQTTQSHASFARFANAIAAGSLHKTREIRIVNTICGATGRRQAAASALAKRHGLVIVVGGRTSSNTKRLAETCESLGAETHLVETAADIDPAWLSGRHSVGVAAGTSTPDQAIDEVVQRMRGIGERR